MDAGVKSLVDFQIGNFFDADLTGATVVTLYLRNTINRDLMPKLLSELQPGTRIVSHSFDMPKWAPEQEVEVSTKLLFLWIVPEES